MLQLRGRMDGKGRAVGLWLNVEMGFWQPGWLGSLACLLPSHIDPESHVGKSSGLLWQASVSALYIFPSKNLYCWAGNAS